MACAAAAENCILLGSAVSTILKENGYFAGITPETYPRNSIILSPAGNGPVVGDWGSDGIGP